MPRDIRRVVTGHDGSGKSRIVIDETMTGTGGHVLSPNGQPNVTLSDIWICTDALRHVAGTGVAVGDRVVLEPLAGGVVFRTARIPPDSTRNFDTMREYFEEMGADDACVPCSALSNWSNSSDPPCLLAGVLVDATAAI